MLHDSSPSAAKLPLWRRTLPFVVGGALVLWVVTKLDVSAFAQAMRQTHYVGLALFAVGFTVTLLLADVFATTYVYQRTIADVRFWDLFIIRTASYLPSMVNHHVGQAWLTYFLSKAYRVSLGRALGSTLLVYATTLGALSIFLVLAMPFNHGRLAWLPPTVATLSAAALSYALILVIRPQFLTNIAVTAPLFDAGLSGHLAALGVRLPHMTVQFIGAWVPFLFFGIHLPLTDALGIIPVLMFVVTLPVSPQGLGTRDALSLALLSGYAHGTPAERASTIAASTLSWVVIVTLAQLAFASLFVRPAHALLQRANAAQGANP